MAIGSAVMSGMSSIGSMFAGSGAAAAAGGAATAAGGGGLLGSLGGFLTGSTAGFSNAGLLSAGLQGLGLIGDLFGGSDEAKAMKKAQEEQWRQQLIATQEAYKTVADAERSAAKQYHADAISNQASLLQQRAQVALLAGATGTGGNSVSSMLNDLAADGGRNQSTIIDNYENQKINFTNQLKSIQRGGQMQMREFKKPSAMSTLVQGIPSLASAYVTGSKSGKALGKALTDSRTYSSGTRGI
ncbi:putative internal virion protein [Escherichia phage vB_EcoP_ACG-C91]|uniref:Putative internal virion protein n=1 Tax=Escherichia phage vB_EcoP_ACG-C91 TaxID=1141139 RepID=K4FBR2_9CAUD|nr:internal virion protein [Escherichia phage vB_EcoP_ACG-C91]AFH19864.1 putative internal virion protein [Escherichia phage vB_EcoP_ACG-C91]